MRWWRRGELNPRPQALRLWIYMFIPHFDLTKSYPSDQDTFSDFDWV